MNIKQITTLITGSAALTLALIYGVYAYLPIYTINELTPNFDNIGTAITTINATDTLKNSRTTINDNFTALNNGKIEVSTTTLPLLTTLANLSTVGTITSGTWNGTKLAVGYGGTGWNSLQANTVLLGNGGGAIATTTAGSDGQILKLVGGVPTWQSTAVDQSLVYYWTNGHYFTASTTFSATTTQANITIGSDVFSALASTTITGAATPQPVYIATTTGAVNLCDADNNDTFYVFDGFAVNNATNGQTVYVKTDGMVSGFTGLTAGADYYVSDTVGTISTTKGTWPISVGRAINTTTIVINKQKTGGTFSATMTDNTNYYAWTDVIVYTFTNGSGGASLGYIDGTQRTEWNNGSAAGAAGSQTMFVPRGSFFKVDYGSNTACVYQPIN